MSSNPYKKPEHASRINPDEWVGIKPKEKMKRLAVDIPRSLHKRMKIACTKNGETIADVIRKILEQKFPGDSLI